MVALGSIRCGYGHGAVSVMDMLREAAADVVGAGIAVRHGSREGLVAAVDSAISRLTAVRNAVTGDRVEYTGTAGDSAESVDDRYSVPLHINGHGVSFEIGPDGVSNAQEADGIAFVFAVNAGMSMNDARALAVESVRKGWSPDEVERVVKARTAKRAPNAAKPAGTSENGTTSNATAAGDKTDATPAKSAKPADEPKKGVHDRRDALVRKMCDKFAGWGANGVREEYVKALRSRLMRLSETSARVFDEFSGVGV